jgi:hypothetical protein
VTVMTETFLSAALDLVAHGWAVFPCKWFGDDAKRPLTPNGHHDASRNPDQIQAWWTRWPTAMIGAPVPESLLVIDIDPRNGGSLAELESLAGPLPATLTAWSGRNDGGRHLYYLRPAGPLTSTRLPKGVDLKANGFCIVPPSIHPASGLSYRWEEWEPVPVPLKLRELLQPLPPRRPASSQPGRSGKPLVDFVAKFITDGVNNALFWAACRAAEDGLLDQIEDELISTAVSVGESEKRARGTVMSARRKITGEV